MNPAIILVRPQFSGNLGSVARAMKNMGLSELRLVEPEVTPKDREAQKMATHAVDLLGRAQTFASLPEALAGFDTVVGTSRKSSKERPPRTDIREFAESTTRLPEGQRMAILFGTEDTGLTLEELKFCHQQIEIPSHDAFPSLNLAQAVMIVCYELYRAHLVTPAGRGSTTESEERGAQFEILEGFYQELQKVLMDSGFLNQDNPETLMRQLRQVFNRSGLTEKEVKIFRGICRQLRWWAEVKN